MYINSNPFSHYGRIVCGDNFIGRQEAIRTIQQRIINSPDPGCLAIIGAPRIGKSSLAYHTLIYPRKNLLKQRIISIRINLPSSVNSHEQLFRKFVSETLDVLEDAEEDDEALSLRGRNLLKENLDWLELQRQVQRFFKRVKQLGWRVVAVIDEFDAARSLFRDNDTAFQSLRELAYEPDWRICLVTLSRRSLPEITNQSRADISNFAGIFLDKYINCFSEKEVSQLLQKIENQSIGITQKILDFFCINTGGHPYLSSALAYQLCEIYLDSKETDCELALQESTPAFLKYYNDLLNILKEDGSLEKLLEIVFGPVVKATRFDSNKLEKYGLIKPHIHGFYKPFSSHFEDYLRLVERTADYWSLWRETEKSLRLLINYKMEEKYKTNNWFSLLEAEKSHIKPIFDNCRKMQKQEQNRFPGLASRSLLDFTYTKDLFEIITSDWTLFQPIFGRKLEDWRYRFEIIKKIRNPMAHNRDGILETYDGQNAESYCKEILEIVNKILKK
jgi:hypothetical protein